MNLDDLSFDGSLVKRSSASSAVFTQIRQCCAQYGFAILKNYVSKQELQSGMAKLKENFDPLNDRIRGAGEYHKVMENYQRLCVGYGEHPGSGELRNTRLFRVFYNPTFCDDLYGFHNIYHELIILRNRLYEISDDFCLNGPENGLFSATRIHQFPSGGGFLQLHRDRDGEIASKEASLPCFLHPLLICSKKGEDFQNGGGIVKYNNEIVFYEDTLEPGDVSIYNGRVEHGVYNVDADKTLDLSTLSGRSSLLVSLFKTR